jgi:hypothetical protein
MTKFIKTLIIINGLIIPSIIVGFLLVKLVEVIINSTRYPHPSYINKDNLLVEKGDTFLLQGISYENPEKIYNSTNYLLKVRPKTYLAPRKISRSSVNFEGGNYYDDNSMLNIVFLDSNFKVIGKLIDKKASILSMTLPRQQIGEPIDTTVKNIAYTIAFDDSNGDGKIDYQDNSDIFISDLNGQNLVKVTSEMDVIDFEFVNHNKQILIWYHVRTDQRDEYKTMRFCIYDILTKQTRKLDDIDRELAKIQTILK